MFGFFFYLKGMFPIQGEKLHSSTHIAQPPVSQYPSAGVMSFQSY